MHVQLEDCHMAARGLDGEIIFLCWLGNTLWSLEKYMKLNEWMGGWNTGLTNKHNLMFCGCFALWIAL